MPTYYTFTVRITDPELVAKFNQLMTATRLTRADCLRELIRNSTIIYIPMPGATITVYGEPPIE
jgi:hypothetical protein